MRLSKALTARWECVTLDTQTAGTAPTRTVWPAVTAVWDCGPDALLPAPSQLTAGSHSAWAWAEARAAFHGRPRVSRLTGGTRKIRDCARGKLNNSEQSVTFERGIPKRCYHRHTAS